MHVHVIILRILIMIVMHACTYCSVMPSVRGMIAIKLRILAGTGLFN